MPVYSSDQFRDHVATEKTPGWSLKGAMESETGQLPLFVQAKDLKSAAKPINGDRGQIYEDDPDTEFDIPGAEYHTDEWGDPYRRETDDEVWERKLNESNRLPSKRWVMSTSGGMPEEVDSKLRADIAEHGMERPVRVAGAPAWGRKRTELKFEPGTVMNGHHRLAVMAEDHPDSWMQVDWDHGPTRGGSLGDRG